MEVMTSPVVDYMESLGCKVEVSNGKKIVRNCNNLEDEIRSLYDGVGLRNISHYGIIELKGNDVINFLHRITTNSLGDVAKESIKSTIFTTEKGRIIDMGTLMNFESHQLLVCSSEHKDKVISWINKYVISDDVSAIDSKNKYNLLELFGPQADSFITLLCGTMTNNIRPNTFKIIHTEGLLFFLAKIKDFNSRLKFWIIADDDNARRITRYLIENKSFFDFNLVGEDAYNSFRIEQGIPASPNELNDEYNPHEARLIPLVDFKKGCYIGQEVIARLDTYDKVQKYLMGIVFDNSDTGNELILYDKNEIEAGTVTSSVYSLRFKKHIGLAYVGRAYAEDGTRLIAKSEDGNSHEVTVKNLPFRK
jgi:folate-binding protein YgfZ